MILFCGCYIVIIIFNFDVQILPFGCIYFPATLVMNLESCINDRDNDNCRIIIMQNKMCSYVNVLTNCVDWKIGFYKNDKNDKCYISGLGKHVVHFMHTFLGSNVVMIDKNGLITLTTTSTPSIIL